jgi:NAD(P)-dependent dehydrogenase (short-subunit alcohol dehydrogenase family)
MTTRTAIITGASRGLGFALTTDLVADGWTVVVDGRDADALRRATAPLGPSVVAVPGDVTDPDHREELIDAAAATGRLDLLVNNASALGPSPLPHLRRLPVTDLTAVLATNVVAPLALAQLALPLLILQRGAVVNVTSDASVEAYEGWGGYGASKAALDHVTRVLAEEEPGVRFWAIDPGDLRTQMHQDAFPGEDISDRPLPETVVPAFRQVLFDRPPSGRLRLADVEAPVVAEAAAS